MSKPKKDIDVSIMERRAYDFLLRQQEAREWMEDMIQEPLKIASTADFVQGLRDGVYLCRLANVFAPGVVGKIYEQKTNSVLEFMSVNNIQNFLKALGKVEFRRLFWFEVTDLWEMKNVYKVVHCIHMLARYLTENFNTIKIKRLKGYNFTQEEINKTKKLIQDLNEMEIPEDTTTSGGADDVASSDSETDPLSEPDDQFDDLADPDKCIISGDGSKYAQAGIEAKFTIKARDVDGNEIKTGGETFTVVLFHAESSDEKIVGSVQDKANGTYEVSYTPKLAGEYSMEIKLIDEENKDNDSDEPEVFLLKGCPMKVEVTSSPNSDPSRCQLDGMGTSSAVAGVEASFNIVSFDAYGNKGLGGETFTAILTSGDNKIHAHVRDNKDSTYTVNYTCPSAGEYDLQVFLNNQPLGGRKVVVKDAGVSSPEKCVLVGFDESLLNQKAGTLSKFQIQAKDKHNNLRSSGGEKFTVTLTNKTSSEVVEANVVDNNDGKYDVDFTLIKSGEYDMVVALNGTPFENKTITVTDTGVTSAEHSVVITDDDYKNLKAGQPKSFTIEARDIYGNKRSSGGDHFTLQVTSKTTLKDLPDKNISVNDNGDGTYNVTYGADEVSEYAMQVLLKSAQKRNKEEEETPAPEQGNADESEKKKLGALGALKGFLTQFKYENISGFPTDIKVSDSGVTDPSKTLLEGDGLRLAVSNQLSTFTVICRDAYTNRRTSGGDEVVVSLINDRRKTSITAEVTDHQDGTYEVQYIPNVSGDYRIEIKINGVLVETGEPLILFVEPPAAKALSDQDLENIHGHDLLSSLINSVLLEKDEESLLAEIQQVRSQLIRQIRENGTLENDVKDLERRIQLLINNRLKMEDLLTQRGWNWRKKAPPKDAKVSVGNEGDSKGTERLEKYGRLFYILQTDPQYLSNCLYLVPQEKVEKFLETVILTLFGYAFSPREEYLILSLFKSTLQLEISKTKKLSGFLEGNPILPRMVMTYGRRVQGKTFLQKVLFDKIISSVLNEKDLNLELNATKIFKEYISKQEVETGVKSGINFKDITYQRAMQDDYVSKVVNERVQKLTDICQSILDGIIDNVGELPYGLRWVCKQLNQMLAAKHPESSEIERASIIGYIAYYRFMNPPICAPDAFQLTKKKISINMRNNLVVISKVLTNLTNNVLFDSKIEEQMTVMNEWLKKNQNIYIEQFIRSLINVEDPEEVLGVHKYMELTQKKAPSITITWNEIFSTHQLLLKYLHKLAPNENDPLRVLLKSMGETAPEEVALEKNEELSLQLINTDVKDSLHDNQVNPDQLYDETKENFRAVLRSLPPDQLGENVIDTIENAKKYASTANTRPNVDPNVIKTLSDKVKQIEEALPKLEEAQLVTRSNNYRKILIDITKEIQNRKIVRAKQQKELERLKESLKSLQEHSKFLTDKINDLQVYIQQSVQKHFDDGASNNRRKKSKAKNADQVYKFSFSQLHDKHKVIEELNVIKSQQNKFKFVIRMSEPGKFDVEAKLAGMTVNTIQLDLADLLDKQSKQQQSIKFEDVTLNVNMTIHILNRLFVEA
jgi:Ras GTPase-activating-like protein IQGAP2/3